MTTISTGHPEEFLISNKMKDIFIFIASCFLAVASIAISRAGDEIVELAKKLEAAVQARDSGCVCDPCEPLAQHKDCSDEISAWKELAENCVGMKLKI